MVYYTEITLEALVSSITIYIYIIQNENTYYQ